MLNKKSTYHFIIGIALLLFSQFVIPNLHHHSERHDVKGINVLVDDGCLICSLDIVPADFILPILFLLISIILLHTSVVYVWKIETIIFSIHKLGRGPPVEVA